MIDVGLPTQLRGGTPTSGLRFANYQASMSPQFRTSAALGVCVLLIAGFPVAASMRARPLVSTGGAETLCVTGLVNGLGSGAVLGFLAGRAADSPTCPRSGIECGQGALIGTVGAAIWGGVGGWLIDALARNREVIYLAPSQP